MWSALAPFQVPSSTTMRGRTEAINVRKIGTSECHPCTLTEYSWWGNPA